MALVVAVGFVHLALGDARTGQVVVARARAVTIIAVTGLGAIGLLAADWWALIGAALGAAVVTGIQYLPYRLQRTADRDWIGRADVRLAVPFGWTLGYFGLGYALAGFATALVTGLAATVIGRRRSIPFVPFLALGLVVALAWALVMGEAGLR